MAKEYDESKIKTLSALEHIRLRSGMYIGRLGDGSHFDDGIYILLKEVVDNTIDEFIMGHGKKVVIDVDVELGRVSVRDEGRGIPLGKVIDCVSIINTGAKYNDDVFQFSVGLNGVGTKAVNALSSHFLVRSIREGIYQEATFSQGKLLSEDKGKSHEKNGVYVEFTPDVEIFGSYRFNMEYLAQRMHSYACLNRGLTLVLNGEKFISKNGLLDYLEKETEDAIRYPMISHRATHLEFAFTHTSEGYGETYFSFVNGQFTSDGGTHLVAFKEGILRGVNAFYNDKFTAQDVREGIAGAVAVKVKDPIFESQTKNKLGNSDIRSWIVADVSRAVEDYLHKNATTAKILKDKILANERLRKELNEVKKEARAAAKRISMKIPKLIDCKLHVGDLGGERSSIFLVEGDSAGGSFTSVRDVHTQAIFKLRGKPWNSYGAPQSAIYRNEELYNMMMALGIENSAEELRYGRIILATDADFDGFHIRNLLLTFFLHYFEELVVAGKIFILETPLFRIKKGKEAHYCYSESERDALLKKLGKGVLVTRFKGLGEISPNEFGQFIGEQIRLTPVMIDSLKQNKEILTFYMGQNTPHRRDYIMQHLIDDIV
ncbi:DNA topoisomerase IV subunit B [Entomospira culicis]|uniref:DNA topoisomerase (ATP-hydrolyzing) n=1 Tax=Entomospira culicis TaxID=2719989 RepID=A0A968GEX1_9SPIO|nr:DNA topoisomerase IV subunit B [Entomospira culicis]NIZ19028.1 type IIA DNA topoisomerase subunit B [Entomospira culicis]NIZ69243.1 type IIA DNA topoisomerase subunit B [Entomospira culicis]WDI37827.1 DNA topoisomerase IV subunit B [Entomospira culicis]WDI39455.1 DNA topoisomerase IV subunit B [Entomospira culicis]